MKGEHLICVYVDLSCCNDTLNAGRSDLCADVLVLCFTISVL